MEANGERGKGAAGQGAMPAPLIRTSSVTASEDSSPEADSSTAVEDTPSSDGGAFVNLRRCLEAVEAAVDAAPAALALTGFGEAAVFAETIEGLSRRVDHLQLLAAAAVDRTRTAALRSAGSAGKAAGWTTGWRPDPASATSTGPDTGTTTATTPAPGTGPGTAVAGASVTAVVDPADDGCRNTAEFLRVRLRISASEARRRLALAAAVLPGTGITGAPVPAPFHQAGAALAAGTIASRAGTIITTALDKARLIASPETLAEMEGALLDTATETDQDFLARIAHRWIDAIDQDGTEPSEEELRHRQGAFLRRPRRGLHHVEIFATTDQYEHLLTVMNTATNPRTQPGNGAEPDTSGTEPGTEPLTGPGFSPAAETAANDAHLERRTRPQQLLDGLIGACKTALAANTLPATGGLRPQVMVTINYQDLLTHLHTKTGTGGWTTAGNGSSAGSRPGTESRPGTGTGKRHGTGTKTGPRHGTGTETGPRHGTGSGNGTGSGTFVFSGPVTASTVRKIACDADIIPVLLGSEGRILDIGRTTRIFPPHIRKALTARDQGCAFPNCTIPAPWCEAHHTTYWSHGGPTNTDNGVLLCTHHHHLIHKEHWQIHIKTGIPWFIPPPHIDPRQKPRRNHHHRT
ncbi:MAG: HNH endonuclease [Actinomycetota bacterium]|nr:HNH endonuclease [Actinomycetota bacterium]